VKYSLGCIGGGQLGRMLALAGAPLDVRFRFLDPAPDACAGDVGELLVGPYEDEVLLDRLAEGTDAVTYEFENVPVAAARRVEAIPDARALERGQDRLVEKELFRSLGVPTARYGSLAESGLPALVKSRRLGYDGKAQRVVESLAVLGDDELAEELVPFDRELSIVAVRGRDGETVFYPLAENEHRGGILAVSRAPARDALQGTAEEIATKLLDELGYVGVLAVELFEVEGKLLANEFAPRVHNTGHWTIDGAVTSQFENHVRAVLGLPLGATDALGECVMVNIVGEALPLERLLGIPGAHVHLYGKAARAGRKLGHVTLVDADEGRVAEVVGLAAAAWA
jgi:5-(carboxyamino)imidazole ribonucleotide synthase